MRRPRNDKNHPPMIRRRKKRLRLGASRKPEPPKSRTLKRNLLQTVRCTACQARSPLSAQCYTAVTPPRFRRGKCDGRHNALPRCNATRRAMFGPSRCRRRGGRNTKQRTTFVFQVFICRCPAILGCPGGARKQLPNCQFVHTFLTKMKCRRLTVDTTLAKAVGYGRCSS